MATVSPWKQAAPWIILEKMNFLWLYVSFNSEKYSCNLFIYFYAGVLITSSVFLRAFLPAKIFSPRSSISTSFLQVDIKMASSYGSLVKEAIVLLDRFSACRQCLDDFMEDAAKGLQVGQVDPDQCPDAACADAWISHVLFVAGHGRSAQEVHTWCSFWMCWAQKVTGRGHRCLLRPEWDVLIQRGSQPVCQ